MRMISIVRFSYRAIFVLAATMSVFAEPARANVFEDIGDFFSGNAPKMASADYCGNYARNAVADAARARELMCPLSGNRYGENEQGHYFWCLGQTDSVARAEYTARNDAVNACASRVQSAKEVAYCEGFAERAVANATTWRQLKCDPSRGSSGIWSTDYNGHFKWCMWSGSYAYRERDDAIRINEVKACVDRGGGEPKLVPIDVPNSGAFPPPPPKVDLGPIQGIVAPQPPRQGPPKTATPPAALHPPRIVKLPPGNNTSGSNMSRQPKEDAPSNSAMDRLGGGGLTTVAPSRGGSSGVSLSRPIPPGGRSSGASPINPPSGGGSSGVNLSRPGQ